MPKVILKHSGRVNLAIPTLEEASLTSVENWGNRVGSMTPSFYPKEFSEFFILGPAKRRMPNSHDCVDFIKTNNFDLSNVQGLVVLELLDTTFDFLKEDSWTMGFDKKDHLWYEKGFGHLVPCLHKIRRGKYNHLYFPWSMNIDYNERVLAFK